MFTVNGWRLRTFLGIGAFLSYGVAAAQSSVTIYGVVDGGLLYTSKTLNLANGKNAGQTVGMTDSGLEASRFGFKGTEDLGDGLKVNFELESGISVANGGYSDSNGNFFGRQAWVSIDGNFGSIKTGLQYSPFYLSLYDSDPRSFSQFGSSIVSYANNAAATGIFTSNSVSYTSPKIAGFTGSVLLALGGEAGDFQAGRQYSARLKYENVNLLVDAAIFHGNSGGTTVTTVPTTTAFVGRTLGASYKVGNLTAKASFVNYEIAGSFDNNVYGVGLDYLAQPQLDIDGGVWVTRDRNNSANHSVMAAMGTQYFLSKTTILYAQVGMVNNHGAQTNGLDVSTVSSLLDAPGTTIGAVVGICHKF